MFELDDVRNTTVRTRLEIGFPGAREEWREATASITDTTLTILGHPVMEDWEAPYMEALAGIAARNGGRVLEVGFGLGISARALQKLDVDEHVIIEANADVYLRLEEFARSARRRIVPVAGFWQDVVPGFADGGFDGILFDTYPLSAAEVHTNHFGFFEHAHRLLRPGGVLTYYSDEVSSLSPAHLRALRAAGFSHIDYSVLEVAPPDGCRYWKSGTIVAPVVLR